MSLLQRFLRRVLELDSWKDMLQQINTDICWRKEELKLGMIFQGVITGQAAARKRISHDSRNRKKKETMLQTWAQGYGSIKMRITRWNHSPTQTSSGKKGWICCRQSSSCLTWSKWAELFSGLPSVNCLSGRRKNSAAVGKPGRTVTRSCSSLTPVDWWGTGGKGGKTRSGVKVEPAHHMPAPLNMETESCLWILA